MTEGPRPAVGAGPWGRGRGLPRRALRVSVRGRPSTCSPPHPRCREGPPSACPRGPMAFRAVWSACTGAGSRPVPSRQSRKGSEQARSGPSRIGPASATGGPGSSRLKATPAAWARFCCCRHAVLGVDARRSVGRSEGPDLGRCPARSPPGEWESGTSAFSFSLLNPGGTDLVVWKAVTGQDC